MSIRPTPLQKARTKLKRAVKRYAKARSDYDFRGSMHIDDCSAAEHNWLHWAPAMLDNAIVEFEAAVRKDTQEHMP